jgi:RimJ/RimL family protein N-acetyltransferase
MRCYAKNLHLGFAKGFLVTLHSVSRKRPTVDTDTTCAQIKSEQITFQKLAVSDLTMLAEWLKRPHVCEWWDACQSLEEVHEKYLPRLVDESSVVPYFAYLDGTPIGYIQSYVATATSDGWWPDEHDPGVRGIDQFLADEQRLRQGLGTRMVTEFVKVLFRDPSVTKIQADPAPPTHALFAVTRKQDFDVSGPSQRLMVRRCSW